MAVSFFVSVSANEAKVGGQLPSATVAAGILFGRVREDRKAAYTQQLSRHNNSRPAFSNQDELRALLALETPKDEQGAKAMLGKASTAASRLGKDLGAPF